MSRPGQRRSAAARSRRDARSDRSRPRTPDRADRTASHRDGGAVMLALDIDRTHHVNAIRVAASALIAEELGHHVVGTSTERSAASIETGNCSLAAASKEMADQSKRPSRSCGHPSCGCGGLTQPFRLGPGCGVVVGGNAAGPPLLRARRSAGSEQAGQAVRYQAGVLHHHPELRARPSATQC